MTVKYILAVALFTPFLTVSSTAQQYHGGPKSSVPSTVQQIAYGDIYAQGIDVYAPRGDVYAPRGDIYAEGVRTNKSRAYRSGPRTVVPYGR